MDIAKKIFDYKIKYGKVWRAKQWTWSMPYFQLSFFALFLLPPLAVSSPTTPSTLHLTPSFYGDTFCPTLLS
jgi:hypothetical protein